MPETLASIRKDLRKIGYKVKTESLSWGRHATFTDAEGYSYPSLFFSDEDRKKWQPLRDYLDTHVEELREIKKHEGIYGLLAKTYAK